MDRVAEGAEVVEGDLLCKGCGYNLRMLSEKGLCPECGAAVAVSQARAGEAGHVRRPGRVVAAVAVLAGWNLTRVLPLLVEWGGVRLRWRYLRLLYAGVGVCEVVGAMALLGALGLLWKAGVRRPTERLVRAMEESWVVVVALVALLGLGIGGLWLVVAEEMAGGFVAVFMGPRFVGLVRCGLEVLMVAGAWRYFREMARAHRAPVVARMTSGLAMAGIAVRLAAGGVMGYQLTWWMWGGYGPVNALVHGGVTGAGVLWNVALAAVYWPMVGWMVWRGRGRGEE
jgi:hypothetical protein